MTTEQLALSLPSTGPIPSPPVAPDGEEAAQAARRDLAWLRKAEHWGEWVRFSETEMAPPESVWMMRHKNGRVRFYAKSKGQVGPEHRHIVAATYWAYANRYLDPDFPIGLNLHARAEVLAGGIADVPTKEVHR